MDKTTDLEKLLLDVAENGKDQATRAAAQQLIRAQVAADPSAVIAQPAPPSPSAA